MQTTLCRLIGIGVVGCLLSAGVAGAEIRHLPGTTTPLDTKKYIHVVSEADSPVQQVYVKSKDGLYIAAAVRTPKGKAGVKNPAIIMFHGAPGGRGMEQLVGWSRGDHGGPVWERFLQEGFVVVVADYRGGNMTLTSSPQANGMLTSIDDGLAIIDYVKARADVDPTQINLYGVSLGGNLVMNLVSRVPDVKSAILGAPATIWFLGMTPVPGAPTTGLDRFKGAKPDPAIATKNIEPIKTPLLILVGTADSLLPVATALHDALAAQQKSVRMEVYENGYHDFVLGPQGQKRPDLPQGEALFDSALDALEKSVRFVKGDMKSAAARYVVTTTPIQVSASSWGVCVGVDPELPQGVWWWEAGSTGCASRTTGPDLFRAQEATVAARVGPGAGDIVDVRFRLPVHGDPRSGQPSSIDVRLTLENESMLAAAIGARVATTRRDALDIPAQFGAAPQP